MARVAAGVVRPTHRTHDPPTVSISVQLTGQGEKLLPRVGGALGLVGRGLVLRGSFRLVALAFGLAGGATPQELAQLRRLRKALEELGDLEGPEVLEEPKGGP